MKRRKPEPAQPRLLAPQPTFDRRQRQAITAMKQAGYWGDRRHRDPAADLLLVRMGLQLSNQQKRWGYQISNPMHYDILTRHPELDDAEPGLAWLSRVYTAREDRMPLTLATARARLQERLEKSKRERPEAFGLRRTTYQPAQAEVPGQQELFV